MNKFFRSLLLCLFLFSQVHAELPKIVAFLGAKRVGKDTSADYLIETHGYKKYSLADPTKIALKSLFHLRDEQLWGSEKDVMDPYWEVTPRELMQFIGIDTLYHGLAEQFPHIGHSFYIKAFDRFVDQHSEEWIVISDLRLQEELYALKERGALVIRIVRPGAEHHDTHSSEADIESVKGAVKGAGVCYSGYSENFSCLAIKCIMFASLWDRSVQHRIA